MNVLGLAGQRSEAQGPPLVWAAVRGTRARFLCCQPCPHVRLDFVQVGRMLLRGTSGASRPLGLAEELKEGVGRLLWPS